MVAIAGACGSRVAPGMDESADSTSTEADDSTTNAVTTSVPTTTGVATQTTSADATGTTTATSGPVDTGTTDVECPDEGDDGVKLDIGIAHECDIFDQDCPRGEKCVGDGIGRICVPITDMPLADGEPCEEMVDGDPCAVGSECTLDPDGEAQGVCRPQCTGSPAFPGCPDGTICVIDDRESVAYCDRPCEPLDPTACEGFACIPTVRGFACLPPGTSIPGEECNSDESCNRDLACQLADDVAGCCSTACCTPLCDAEHPCLAGDCIAIDPPLAGGEGVGWCRTG